MKEAFIHEEQASIPHIYIGLSAMACLAGGSGCQHAPNE
jgi:hypothetical protein